MDCLANKGVRNMFIFLLFLWMTPLMPWILCIYRGSHIHVCKVLIIANTLIQSDKRMLNSQKSSAYRPKRNKLPITLQYLGICMTSDVLKQFSVLQPWGYTLKGYILKSCITNGKMFGNKAWGSTNIYPHRNTAWQLSGRSVSMLLR